MLVRPPREALSANFAGQWLQTRRTVEIVPDPALYPEYDDALRSAMIRETQLFCRSIQDEDRSIIDFLDADYTFVNERLARHYGIEGVSGEAFRRVSLAGTPRAGVLTQASVLAATSNPTRTSPVKRGKWILENILGTPPAPPPSGVEALKEGGAAGSSGTLRDRMERHRTDPACASCHRRMDPLGFALENFDAVGAWRTVEDGRPIDATGRLPAGRDFRAPRGCGPCSGRVAMPSPDASPRRCSPTRSDAASTAPIAATSITSSPGSRRTGTGSRPWCSPWSRVGHSSSPRRTEGRHEPSVADLAKERPRFGSASVEVFGAGSPDPAVRTTQGLPTDPAPPVEVFGAGLPTPPFARPKVSRRHRGARGPGVLRSGR